MNSIKKAMAASGGAGDRTSGGLGRAGGGWDSGGQEELQLELDEQQQQQQGRERRVEGGAAAVEKEAGPAVAPGAGEGESEGQMDRTLQRLLDAGARAQQECQLLAKRKGQLQEEVAKALKQLHRARADQSRLEEELSRERDHQAMALQDEAVAQRRVAQEEIVTQTLRAQIDADEQHNKDQIQKMVNKITCLRQMMKEAPRSASEVVLRENLKKLQRDNAEIAEEVTKIAAELDVLKSTFDEMLQKGDSFEICSDQTLPAALKLLISDMSKECTHTEKKITDMETKKEQLKLESVRLDGELMARSNAYEKQQMPIKEKIAERV